MLKPTYKEPLDIRTKKAREAWEMLEDVPFEEADADIESDDFEDFKYDVLEDVLIDVIQDALNDAAGDRRLMLDYFKEFFDEIEE